LNGVNGVNGFERIERNGNRNLLTRMDAENCRIFADTTSGGPSCDEFI